MRLEIFKKEKEDLEKLVNRKNNMLVFLKKFKFLALLMFLFAGLNIHAQDTPYIKGDEYILKDITVNGLKNFNEQTVITYTGLKKGQKIRIPGEQISAIISKLWKLDLFSDINFYLINIEDGEASIQIDITELPTLSDFKITGLKKSKIETIVSDTELKKGKKITENFNKTTKNYIINKYKKDGFLNTKVAINIVPDTSDVNLSKMLIKVDLGDRVKIDKINFVGNEISKSSQLKKKMKNTKVKLFGRFWKKSKFIEEEYKEDLTSILDFYKEKGYRDARILTDSIITDKIKLTINIDLEEGTKYYFGEISLWTGVALIAFSSLSGLGYIALISPLFVYALLSKGSGIPLLERSAEKRWGEEADYKEYKKNTPVLFPKLFNNIKDPNSNSD